MSVLVAYKVYWEVKLNEMIYYLNYRINDFFTQKMKI